MRPKDSFSKTKKHLTILTLGMFLLVQIGCLYKNYTNLPREDKVKIKMNAENQDFQFFCNTCENTKTDKIIYEISFPENFDSKLLLYEEQCSYQLIGDQQILVYLGSIGDIHSYLILNADKNTGIFYFYTDRNSYDAKWWFKHGHLTYSRAASLRYSVTDDTLAIELEVAFKRPLFRKDDLSMSDLVGYSKFLIHGCTSCTKSDSTINKVLQSELEYLTKHEKAIDDKSAFKKGLLNRLNLNKFPK